MLILEYVLCFDLLSVLEGAVGGHICNVLPDPSLALGDPSCSPYSVPTLEGSVKVYTLLSTIGFSCTHCWFTLGEPQGLSRWVLWFLWQ